MLFKGSIVTAASGKMGGIVASHNSGGQYFRQFVVPTDPASTQQQQRRVTFGNGSNRWSSTLTEAERNAWNAIAATITAVNALGDPITLSGQQAYVRAYTLAMLAGLTPPDTAPGLTGETPLGTLSLTGLASGTQTIQGLIADAPDWAGDDDGRLLIFLGRGVSPAVSFYKGPFQFVAAEPGNTAAPIVAYSQINPATNFQIVAGLRYYVRFVAYLNGQVSQSTILNRIAT